MLEPDVTLTDLALALECTVFSVVLFRRSGRLYRLFAALFTVLAVSSGFGALWHGVFSADQSLAGSMVWFCVMAALSLAALLLWFIAAALSPWDRWAAIIRPLAAGQFAFQIIVAVFVSDSFAVGAVGMLLPVGALFAAYIVHYLNTPRRKTLLGAAGLALTGLASLVIVFEASLHPRWATPLAVFHLIQLLAFWMVFLSIPAIARPRAG